MSYRSLDRHGLKDLSHESTASGQVVTIASPSANEIVVIDRCVFSYATQTTYTFDSASPTTEFANRIELISNDGSTDTTRFVVRMRSNGGSVDVDELGLRMGDYGDVAKIKFGLTGMTAYIQYHLERKDQ